MDRQQAVATLTTAATLGGDRLSKLPEVIMFRIFSSLGVNDTVRLGAVSKRLRHLCKLSPHLYFRFDFDNCPPQKSEQFIAYVDGQLEWRLAEGVRTERFLIHLESGDTVGFLLDCNVLYNKWLLATQTNLRELDITLDSGGNKFFLPLPDCAYDSKTLRLMRLNFPRGGLNLEHKGVGSIQELCLTAQELQPDIHFGEKIGVWWTSLKRLSLVGILINIHLRIESWSLEELIISQCRVVVADYECHTMTIRGPSLKAFTISGTQVVARSKIAITCDSLENFLVCGTLFERTSVIKIKCASLESVQVCGCSFLHRNLEFAMHCPTIKQLKVSHCIFGSCCTLETNCLSIEECIISECKTYASDIYGKRPILVGGNRLQRLNLVSSHKYMDEFLLDINAPSLEVLSWEGNPMDFTCLDGMPIASLVNARIDFKPPCRHKNKEAARLCKLFASKICCVVWLLKSLCTVKSLTINLWPIELFFMQTETSLAFDNLQYLEVVAANHLLADQVSVIASFLRGMRDLRVLTIRCDKSSPILGDPNNDEKYGKAMAKERWLPRRTEQGTLQNLREESLGVTTATQNRLGRFVSFYLVVLTSVVSGMVMYISTFKHM
ncbi:hypothetical protein Tsubulata_009486, partial [Turnera subulata]